MINSVTREKIKGYIGGFIQGIIDSHKVSELKPFDLRPIREYSKEGNIKPFHEALIPHGILLINEFERTFSTGLGSTFEETARLIASDIHTDARRQFRIEGTISTDAITEIEQIINGIDKNGMKKSFHELIHQVLSKSNNLVEERLGIADLYVKKNNGDEMFFEIKSPKPNKGQCLEVTKRLLSIHALKQSPTTVKTYYAMAYNPNGNSKTIYNHSFAKKFLDINNEVLIGNEFWDTIGEPGTYKEVLEIYKEIGVEKGPDMIKQLALE